MNKEEIEERINYAKSNFTDGIEIFLEIIEKQRKSLEQKESILDKVTDKLIEDKVKLTEELKYNITKREARLQLILVDKYLNIIEGEKK